MMLGFMIWFIFFFFKQKTAYEMRISDWSSDVCSSDLMAQGNQSNRNRGRYGQDFSAPPKQGENESRADYNQRLKEWQRRRSMSGGKAGTQTTAQPKSKPAAKSQKKESPGGWMGKVVRALSGKD